MHSLNIHTLIFYYIRLLVSIYCLCEQSGGVGRIRKSAAMHAGEHTDYDIWTAVGAVRFKRLTPVMQNTSRALQPEPPSLNVCRPAARYVFSTQPTLGCAERGCWFPSLSPCKPQCLWDHISFDLSVGVVCFTLRFETHFLTHTHTCTWTELCHTLWLTPARWFIEFGEKRKKKALALFLISLSMCKSHWILHPPLNSITGSCWRPALQSKCVLHFFHGRAGHSSPHFSFPLCLRQCHYEHVWV